MSKYLRRLGATHFFALAILCLAPAGAAWGAEAANTIRYGIDDEQNISRLPLVIAEREGLFAREGMKLEIVHFVSSFRNRAPGQNRAAGGGNPGTVGAAMTAGTIDMSRQQLPLLINANIAGGTNVGVAVASSNPVYFLVAQPDIKSFGDLKGKTVTVTNLSDGITIWTRKLMAQHGLKNDDVTLKVIAGSDARINCLKSGECAAASLAQPTVLDAVAAGNHVLGMTNEIAPMLNQLDIVNPAWAAAHRDLLAKYIRATTAATRFIQDPKNRDEVVKVTMDFMKEPESRARQMLAYIWDPKNRVFPSQTGIDVNSVKVAISLMGEYGVLKKPLPAPERFVDASYSKAAGQ